MTLPPKVPTWMKTCWLVFAGLVAAFVMSRFVTYHHHSTSALVQSEQKMTAKSVADSLLLDSIVSIVQSYYVDSDRVSNDQLLRTAVQALQANPLVSARFEGGALTFAVDGHEQRFANIDDLEYERLLGVLQKISEMVVGSGEQWGRSVEVAKGEATSSTMINALLSTLDAHSALLSENEYRELRQGTEGSFGGLGLLVGIRDHMLTVIKPLPRSPARRSGVEKHDRILAINDVSTFGYGLDDLVDHMRGDPGTAVNLTLLKQGALAPTAVSVRREVIHVDSVESQIIKRGGVVILHLSLENFSSRTSREVLSAIKRARSEERSLDGLIIDLRSNPGGLLDQAVQVADLFLDDGVIVSTRGRREEVERAGSGFDEMSYPIVVLINGDSASASEIVAGALQDHGRAVLIGQPSFGKGSVQTIFELPGERALKLTIARYYTPNHRSIQNVGIIPNVWLHPVYRHDKNLNLLGAYRYKNERFLKHHLTVARREMRPHRASIKSFYLTDPNEDQQAESKREDPELNLAIKMIGEVKKAYGSPIPPEFRRSSHWLALSGPIIKKIVGRSERDAVRWMKKKHKVDWAAGRRGVDGGELELEVNVKGVPAIEPGQTLKVPWAIRNLTLYPVNRVSLFIRSELPGFETEEVLVGRLKKSAVSKGVLEVPVPPYWQPGTVILRVGLAIEAWPVTTQSRDLAINILPRDEAKIKASVALLDAKTGRLPGILEVGERAQVEISLLNEGQAAAANLEVGLLNLAGKQIQVEGRTKRIRRLGKGEQKKLRFKVTAGDRIAGERLGLGVHVESRALSEPYDRAFEIKGQPLRVSLGH